MGRFPQRRGQQGRGRGNANRRNDNKNQSKEKKKKTLTDYTYYLGSARQASDYEVTTEYLINYIKKTFDYGTDIAKALKTLEEVDFSLERPQLSMSVETNAEIKAHEDKQFEMEFKQDYDEYRRKIRHYENNKVRAYGLLWDRCATGMQNKIQSRVNFESDIENDPIKLLQAIKEHALNYQENRYEMSIILDAMRTMVSTKQKESESLTDYTKRFKTARDVFVSHLGGPLIMTKYVRSMEGYDEDDEVKVKDLNDKAFGQLTAYLYLENADQDKYGSILTGLNTQKTLKNDQYPKSLIDANNVLSCHKFDPGHRKPKPKKENNNKKKDKDESDDNNADPTPSLSFAQLEGKCYCCGDSGHKSPNCDKRDSIAKNDWYVNKMKRTEQSHAQVGESPTSGTATTNPPTSGAAGDTRELPVAIAQEEKASGWCGAHIALQFYQADVLKTCILLDNESTTSIFCNKDYVVNIRDAKGTMDLQTNGGILQSEQHCDVPLIPDLQECWFNKKAVTNILSYHDVASKYRITYDNKKADYFTVHLGSKKLLFKPLKNGLYAWKPSPNEENAFVTVKSSGHIFLNSLEENKKFYTDRQFERAKRACQYYHAMGTPSVSDLLSMMRMNLVKNCPVTVEDVRLAEKIFGPDIGSLKGKTTRRTPAPVVKDEIEIPPELIQTQRDVVLEMDGLTVNSVKFLTTISRNLCYRTAHYVSRRTTESYETALTSLVGVYNRGGFLLREIHCDNEFRPLMGPLGQQHGIVLNFANPQEHVPRAERNNRTIKERSRSTYHRLPFTHLPRLMVIYLVTEATKKLNFYPARNGVSQYYSPRMILHHQTLDYDKHCRYVFGTYVQAHDEPDPSNTNAPRTLDCIYLGYNPSQQGGHILLHLQTNKTIVRRTVTAVPITPHIIRQVHSIAEHEGMPDGLKITNCFGEILYDSTWIAGVDFDEEDDNSSSDDDDSDYQDDDSESTSDDNDDDDRDDGDEYEIVDRNEIEDLLAERGEPGGQQRNLQTVGSSGNPDSDPDDSDDEEDDNSNDGRDDNESDDPDDDNPTPDDDQSTNPSTSTKNTTTRSGRVSKAPERLNLYNEDPELNLFDDDDPDNPNNIGTQTYSVESARVIANFMNYVAEGIQTEHGFVQTYSLKAGIRKFGEKGKQAAHKEMRQLHDRQVFEPINVNEMPSNEKRKAMESLIFLVEKRDKTVKARTCANGSVQRDYIDRDQAASPTAQNDAILITAVIDACQKRDVMIADVPNAFVQTPIDQSGEKIIMKIRGMLVDMLVEMNPELYSKHVMHRNGKKLLFVRMLKALYGMMIASLLYYKKFSADIKTIGFVQNPYDPCVANRTVEGKQHTITWHVDDIKSSHVNPKVNDDFLLWLEKTYGEDGIGKVKATRGLRHDYLAMMLDFTTPGVLKLDMTDYVKGMISDFPEDIGEIGCPWTDKLFKVDKKSKPLSEEKKSIFHTFVMKGMFVCKRARQDIQPAIAFLCTRTGNPTENDWGKLIRLLRFLNRTQDDVLTLEAGKDAVIRWHVDASFAVHADYKSHTGATMSIGRGVITSISTKQKVNSRSSTEAELIGIDDVASKILWTALFIESQGFKATTMVDRDNTSSMKLELNGKASSGKRTRHFHIKYFYVTDLIEQKLIYIQYCPTDQMLADYMTKPLVGALFKRFRIRVMNLPVAPELSSRSVLADMNSVVKCKTANGATSEFGENNKTSIRKMIQV